MKLALERAIAIGEDPAPDAHEEGRRVGGIDQPAADHLE